MGETRALFCIDAKLFSFSFDGGRSDSYAIHENHRNVKSSIWVGHKGMEWILLCFADICDWVPGKDFFCKRFRENNKLLEYRGRSNEAGLLLVIAMFLGGARQGWIMIPESINRSGWILFQKELGVFLIGETPRLGGVILDIPSGAGPANDSGRNGQKMHNYGNMQKSRFIENLGANLGRNVIQGDSTVKKSVISGRPTCAFNFQLTFETLALRIIKPKGGKHSVSWLEPNDRGLNKVGLIRKVGLGLSLFSKKFVAQYLC